MRNTLWLHILEDLGPPEGYILPMWLRIVYILIFPLQGLRFLLGNATGFDFTRMTYEIHGVQYSSMFFLRFKSAGGELYRLTNVNGVVTIQEVHEPFEPFA